VARESRLNCQTNFILKATGELWHRHLHMGFDGLDDPRHLIAFLVENVAPSLLVHYVDEEPEGFLFAWTAICTQLLEHEHRDEIHALAVADFRVERRVRLQHVVEPVFTRLPPLREIVVAWRRSVYVLLYSALFGGIRLLKEFPVDIGVVAGLC
jgi:hypothetical protein